MSYWPVSLHPFCPLQFILYTSARGIFLQGKAMHSNAFRVKMTTLSWPIKLWSCVFTQFYSLTSTYLPIPHAPSQFHSANHTGLSSPQAHPALLHISTFKSVGFFLLVPASPMNLPSQFLFILAVSAELPLPQRNLLQVQTSSRPIS